MNPPNSGPSSDKPSEAVRTFQPENVQNPSSSYQLYNLRKGRKVNIVVGPYGDGFIGVEGAFVSVLAHFAPYAKFTLIDLQAPTLVIPNGSQKTMNWIYKYMAAGEHDVPGITKFGQLSYCALGLLHQHCKFLGYRSLLDRTAIRLAYKLQRQLVSIEDLHYFSRSDQNLFSDAVNTIARRMVIPQTRNFTSYWAYAATNRVFQEDLGRKIQELLKKRIKIGQEYYSQPQRNGYIRWSENYYRSVARTRSTTQSAQDTLEDRKGLSKSSTQKKGNVL